MSYHVVSWNYINSDGIKDNLENQKGFICFAVKYCQHIRFKIRLNPEQRSIKAAKIIYFTLKS